MDKTEASSGSVAKNSSEITIVKSSNGRTSKIEIRPPKTSGDNIIQHFEMNLEESIALLKTYQLIEERNKKVHEELESGKQTTIAKLVQHLMQRRKDHETVSKCITILKKIKGEYEKVKREIAEEVKLQGKCLVEDKATQCDDGIAVCNTCGAIEKQKATNNGCTAYEDGVPVTNLVVDVLQNKSNTINLKLAYSNQDGNDDSDESCDEIPSTAVSQNMFATQGSQRRKSSNPRRHVTFLLDRNDENRTDSSEDGSDFKRAALAPTPVNLYANIMPRDAKMSSSARKIPSGTPRESRNVNQRPLPFCLKKRFRVGTYKTEAALRQIYSMPGSLALPKIVEQGAEHASAPLETVPLDESAGTLINTAAKANSESIIQKPKALGFDSLEDYTPMDIPQLRSNSRYQESNRVMEGAQGFSAQLSTRLKKPVNSTEGGNSARRRLNQKPKRLDLSLRGKPLVQTTLAFQNVEINDDSTSSESDGEKQKFMKLNTNGIKYVPLVGNVR